MSQAMYTKNTAKKNISGLMTDLMIIIVMIVKVMLFSAKYKNSFDLACLAFLRNVDESRALHPLSQARPLSGIIQLSLSSELSCTSHLDKMAW